MLLYILYNIYIKYNNYIFKDVAQLYFSEISMHFDHIEFILSDKVAKAQGAAVNDIYLENEFSF